MSEGGFAGMDRSVPYHSAIMVKSDPEAYPRYALPSGYSIALYEAGMEEGWARLQSEVGGVGSIDRARTVFAREFLLGRKMDWEDESIERVDPADVPSSPLYGKARERIVLALDPSGEVAGTGALWDGDHFGETLPRVHYIGVGAAHQGRGIAKAIMTRLMDLCREVGSRGDIYLTTQSWSHRAIRVYKRFGFVPYIGEKPVNWKLTAEDEERGFREAAIEAWELINGIIGEGGGGR